MKTTHEKERVGALSAGLAVVILIWIAGEAFASEWIGSLGGLSIWLYGPITAAAWGLFSTISYVLILRAQRRNPLLCPEHEEAARAARGAATGELAKVPKCIEEVDALEKDKLAALMAGFAITIAAWLAVLSFGPFQWLASISPWIYWVTSIALWSGSAELMYWGFRSHRLHLSSIPGRH
jgi:hypothetical protein